MPPPDECPRARPNAPDGTHITLYESLDLRYDPTTVQWARPKFAHLSHEPLIRAWVRVEDAATDPYAVAVAADALPPAVFALGYLGWSRSGSTFGFLFLCLCVILGCWTDWPMYAFAGFLAVAHFFRRRGERTGKP